MVKSKKIICVLGVFFVLLSCAFPAFAVTLGWGDTHQNSSPQLTLPLSENAGVWGINGNEYSQIIAIVENSYKIGMFGGAVPLFITIDVYSNHNPTPVYVHFANPTIPTAGGNKYDGMKIELNSSNALAVRYYITESSFSTANVQAWTMTQSGEWGRTTGGMTTATQLSATGRKLLAWFDSDVMDWRMGYELLGSSSALVSTPLPVGGNNATLQDILQMQEQALDKNVIERPQYTLDIPGIITAVPNGAKQFINNAFGFEIFGINVAGLLSVLLVVTVVAFVVKWLMTR